MFPCAEPSCGLVAVTAANFRFAAVCIRMDTEHWGQGSFLVSPTIHRSDFFRFPNNRRAFCLGVTGFTNPPISQALVAGHAKQIGGTVGVGDL